VSVLKIRGDVMESTYVSDRNKPEDVEIPDVGMFIVFTTDDYEFTGFDVSELSRIPGHIEEALSEGWYFHSLYLNGKRMAFKIVTLVVEMEETQ
jgi:hypothetical protein